LLKSEWHNLIAELTNGTALFCRRTKNAAVGEAVDGLTALNKDKERTASADMRILSLLYGIFAELEDAGMIRHNLTSNAKKSEFCGQVLEFLEMNYKNDITTELLCREFPYSYSHFCRLFKQNFGKPFFSYLMEFRIGQAIQLYMSEQSEKLPIREIAQRVGIPDQYRFSHSFKKIVGISPSEYMRAKATRTP
ncbi:MAG: helix-turn-helix transcriptional regulator, partial [Clostridia bacterium]|nr:helix-turn-helix transcriptional regulator [Clostridia bacterium]